MEKYVAVILAGLFGVASGLQPSINTALGKFIGSKGSALVSFTVGMAALLAINAWYGNLGQLKNIVSAPWYLWIGGLLGAFLVYTSILILPVIGAGAMISIGVALQLLTAVVIDHFGWLGTEVIPVDWSRIVGVLLLMAGVRLIVR